MRVLQWLRLVAAVSFLLISIASAQSLDVSKLAGMKARAIGPAGMSGRIADIEVDPSDKDIIYIGSASGGLWKSVNGGITWKPLFDNQPVASIGAVAVDPTNSDVLWVGTGEANPRNSAAVGYGVFKSLDGGVTWKHLGLEKTEHISRLAVHPRRPEIAYVAALGALWGENPQRGVFKTVDGGKTWDKVLYINERTGAADLVMDPHNPDKLIAAMWEHRRWPWSFNSGGSGSGIYVSFDGGESWSRRTEKAGLPKSELGRIGLGIARSRPDVVYALVEAEKSALLRSDDGGINWRTVNDSNNVNPRPFYYADIEVDPQNENRIYSLHSRLNVSEDGGKTFRSLVESSRIHGDHQALWIDPDDSSVLWDGSDGGVAVSRDLGRTWRFVENLPLAQFYHIAVDLETPYNVYGGLQDNGSWRGPSRVWANRGIYNWYWSRVGSGDGFDVRPDAAQPDRYGYSMSQGGNLRRYDLVTGERRVIKPVHPDGVFLRFNWNAAIAQDPFEPATIYYGSQFVHKSEDRGDSWEIISPDLTTDDPEKQKQLDSGGLTYDVTGAENYTTIVAIAPSPVQRGVIWAGTDDGQVQVTRDGGKKWENVGKNISGLPANPWVPHIEASPHDAATAFAVFDNHRQNDWTTYVYKTTDYGKTWTSLAGEDVWGWALAIEQDPVEPRLLFLGTEFGLYFSLDGGGAWSKWTSGFPTVSAMDLAIHPREHDLVIGTHGRSAFVLDDVRPLRQLARQGPHLLDRPLYLFPVADAHQYNEGDPPGLRGPGDAVYQGENRPLGALISFVVNDPNLEEVEETPASAEDDRDDDAPPQPERDDNRMVKIEVLDADGNVVRTLRHRPRPGLNRAFWELDRKGVRIPGFGGAGGQAQRRGEPGGFWVLPGSYTIRISYADLQESASMQVLADPRIDVPEADMEAKDALVQKVYALVESGVKTGRRLQQARRTAGLVTDRLDSAADKEKAEDLRRRTMSVRAVIDELTERMQGKRVQGIRRDPETLRSKLGAALFSLGNYWAAPTPEQLLLVEQAKAALAEFQEAVEEFFSGEWKDYREAAEAAGVSLFSGARGSQN